MAKHKTSTKKKPASTTFNFIEMLGCEIFQSVFKRFLEGFSAFHCCFPFCLTLLFLFSYVSINAVFGRMLMRDGKLNAKKEKLWTHTKHVFRLAQAQIYGANNRSLRFTHHFCNIFAHFISIFVRRISHSLSIYIFSTEIITFIFDLSL